MMRCTCCGLWTIEVVEYTLAARGRNGRWLRLRRRGVVLGEYRTPAELVQGLEYWHEAPDLAQFTDQPER